MSYIIPLIGYNSPPLSLNQRSHWAKTRSTAQKLAGEVIRSANVVKLPKGLERVHVTLHLSLIHI